MAVDSILPKPELRFVFGLTASCGEVFCVAFRGRHEAHFLFILCFTGSRCGVDLKQYAPFLFSYLLDTQGGTAPSCVFGKPIIIRWGEH